MQIIENKLIKEKVYVEKLDSGFTIMCIPKNNTNKKYAICGVGFGSNYNHFIKDNGEEVCVPDGVAHFLEHKLFEQENGVDSLEVLSSLGVEPNAYTTNEHTAYLFECTKNYDEALDELLNYIQNPYFTDKNVKKEKGIIFQEISMYDDEPEWKVYMNCMKALYKSNSIRIDVAGSIESVEKINKEILYECYNSFYIPENMVLVLVGKLNPEKEINKIKSKITMKNKFTPKILELPEPDEINQKEITEKMDIIIPIFTFGYKVNLNQNEKVKQTLAIEIILEMLFGESSDFHGEAYEKGLIYEPLLTSFETGKEYSHILIQGKSENINEVEKLIKKTIKNSIENGIKENEFERAKRKIYGLYVREFDSVDQEANAFITNYFKEINPFEYIENYRTISLKYLEKVLKNDFKEEKMVKSSIIPKE